MKLIHCWVYPDKPIYKVILPPVTGNLTSMFLPAVPLYEKSQIYRSSKPDKDDPTGDDGDSDGEVKPYSPMYRVYKFKSSLKKAR